MSDTGVLRVSFQHIDWSTKTIREPGIHWRSSKLSPTWHGRGDGLEHAAPAKVCHWMPFSLCTNITADMFRTPRNASSPVKRKPTIFGWVWYPFCGSWGFPNSNSTLSWDLQMDMWRGSCLSKEHCKPNMSPSPPVTNSSNSRPDNETKCMCSFCMIPLGHCLPVFESHPDQSHSASSSRRIAQVLSKMRAPLVRLWRSNGRHLPGGMQWTCLRNPTWHRFISKQVLSLHKLVLGLTPHIRNGILHTWSATRKSTTGATLARAWCRLGKGFFTQNSRALVSSKAFFQNNTFYILLPG